MKEWGAFAQSLDKHGVDVRLVNVCLDNHQQRILSYLRYFDYLDIGLDLVENYLDITNLRTALSVRVVPTFVFIDRRSGSVSRLEGHQTEQALRTSLLQLVDKDPDQDWPPRPSWFSVKDAYEVDSEEQRGIFPQGLDPAELPPNSSPVMPRTAPAPWIPEE
ncbi:MAG: TlpA family protein disulfide reductase, partial [Planctomycetota bacterium]